jgi:hypothetical protein
MDDVGDFSTWCTAAVERVAVDEVRSVPPFAVALTCYNAWHRLTPNQIPSRQDLDPLRFGSALLPHLTLLDVLDGGVDWRWRLCGEFAASIMGTRLAGKCLSEIEVDLGETVLFREALDEVVREGQPFFYVLRHRTIQGGLRRSYGALLPLIDATEQARAKGQVGYVLGACDWTTGE